MFATSMWEIGWHRFANHLLHPHVDSGAYDLLTASLVGAIAVLLGITAATFAAGAAVGSMGAPKHERLHLLVNSRLWFLPSTLLMYTLAALASTAYGFPRYSSAILIQAGLGVGAWFAFVLLNAKAAAMMLGRTSRHSPAQPLASKPHETRVGQAKSRTSSPEAHS
jgi:hypothetical protein